MSINDRVPFGSTLRPLTVALALVLVALVAPFGSGRADASTAVAAGYRDFVYNGDPTAPGGDDVTAAVSQSKLWFNDGRWWGMLFDQTTTNPRFRIWKFDMGTQNWTNTNVAVDDRNRSHGDALWVGTSNTLYVASARREGALATGRDLRIYRYAYNAANDTYTVASGFPKSIPGTASGTGYPTIARDGNGHLWVAFVQASRVRYSTSTDNGVTWSVPADIPGMGNNVSADDLVTVSHLTEGVGFLWSNGAATDDAYYFVAHTDGGAWQARETALGTPGVATYTADSHISLKEDAAGNLIAAIKTAKNDDPSPNAGDPLIAVIKRTGSAGVAGAWESHTVTTVGVKGTRPVLVLDDAASQANVFLTYPTLKTDGDQAIYRRTAPLSTLNFGTASIGTPFIDSQTELAINDATSTKQRTTVASGIIVEAVDVPTFTYLHGCAGSVCPVTPFGDIANSPFKADIEWVYVEGITTGCSETMYCPDGFVTREQMASFLARALSLSGPAPDAFTDDETSIHEPNINLIAEAGIASGCSATTFCPTGFVTREQMASFLARALDLSGPAPDAFTDDENSIHEPNINFIAREGITTGCTATTYCPTANVTRGQMAAFLHRAFGP